MTGMKRHWTYGSFVVTKISSRGTPDSRMALPTCSSLAAVRRSSVATIQCLAHELAIAKCLARSGSGRVREASMRLTVSR